MPDRSRPSRSVKRPLFTCVAVCVAVGAWSLSTAPAGRSSQVPVPDFPIGKQGTFLRECAKLHDPERPRCYVRGLLADVERSHDPARELPRIDGKVHGGGGYLEANCHLFMHEVGRTWAQRHAITLETMYRYVPRSNDPGCSAGFGMGMVMHLGVALVIDPRKAIPICSGLPTRFRQYTCFHGSGHAFMRGYHGVLSSAISACKSLGARYAPDCAQGAFPDYWISLSGGDDTQRPKQADTNPRSVCANYVYARPCWYRFFWERRQNARVENQADLVRLCTGLARRQRAGCIGGASLLLVRVVEPIDHALICGRLAGPDAMNCLRGVNVPALVGDPYAQLRLVRTCAAQPESTRTSCYRWFGRTLNVVTNGRFERSGCPKLRLPEVRAACIAGAHRFRQPLATFS
jgi:hypothetical protein